MSQRQRAPNACNHHFFRMSLLVWSILGVGLSVRPDKSPAKHLNVHDLSVTIMGLGGTLDARKASKIGELMTLCHQGASFKCNLLLMLKGDASTLKQMNASTQNLHLVADPEDFGHMPRTWRLAKLRNLLLDRFLHNELFSAQEYFIVADFDGVFGFNERMLAQLGNGLANSTHDWAALSFNSDQYYDWFALRCSAESKNCYGGNGQWVKCHDAANFPCLDKLRALPESDTLEVASAFNGIAIYKTRSIRDCRYDGDDPVVGQACEHVSFHQCLRHHGGRVLISGLKIQNYHGGGELYPHWYVVIRSRLIWYCIAALLIVCFIAGVVVKQRQRK